MKQKLYNDERDTDQYDNLVMKHMLAMTTEDLHCKSAIAVELAYRDHQIDKLRKALQRISLCSVNIISSKHECGQIARKALEQTC